jgi:uncharacterized protein YecT (DUF1311 family)
MGMRLPAAAVLAVAAACSSVHEAAAQERGPTAAEVSAIAACAEANHDNVDEGERRCIFKLVADRCIKRTRESNAETIGCYDIELKIWDDLLNKNFQALRAELDEEQLKKLREMQQAWITYRDRTCAFYYDKIQGSMAGPMGAACRARETARRALLLAFFRAL